MPENKELFSDEFVELLELVRSTHSKTISTDPDPYHWGCYKIPLKRMIIRIHTNYTYNIQKQKYEFDDKMFEIHIGKTKKYPNKLFLQIHKLPESSQDGFGPNKDISILFHHGSTFMNAQTQQFVVSENVIFDRLNCNFREFKNALKQHIVNMLSHAN